MKRYPQVAGFILAGGASSRMGHNKGLLDFGGVPLLLQTARLLEPFVDNVTVVGSSPQYAALGIRTIVDEMDGYGPLAGISAALSATQSNWNLIVACDMPYLSAEWIDWLLSRTLRSRRDALVPQTARGIEPLAAVYRRECGTAIRASMARGVRKVTDAVRDLRLDLIQESTWRRIGLCGSFLKNMNTPQDYEEAKNWWAANRMRADRSVKRPRKAPKRRQSAPRPRI